MSAPHLSKPKAALLLCSALLMGVLPLAACVGPDLQSVHFTDPRVDFLEMPGRWTPDRMQFRALPPSEWGSRSQAAGVYGIDRVYEIDNNPVVFPDQKHPGLGRRALAAEQKGRFPEAAALWLRYRDTLPLQFDADESSGQPVPRSLVDRILALQLWRAPADTASLRAYLEARTLTDHGRYPEAAARLRGVTHPRYSPLAEYLAAALRYYHTTSWPARAALFSEFRQRHPRSALALYMLGRSYIGPYLHGTPSTAPDAPQRRSDLQRAAAAYAACYRAEPRGLLARDALGMEGAAFFRLGDPVRALQLYCRQLALLPPGHQDGAAFQSASLSFQEMGSRDHARLQRSLLADPELACIYLDLLLQYQSVTAGETRGLGEFALHVLQRAPRGLHASRLLTRLALVETRNGHPQHAEKLLRRALRENPSDTAAAETHWQLAQALRALRRPREALAEYEQVAAARVTGQMRRAAHEAAAVMAESLGDYPDALRHYFALEYRLDYSYVADCLASPDDLRAFVKRYPADPHTKLVRYSLGFRQLRAGEYRAAITTFRSLGPWLDAAERKYPAETSKEKPRLPPLQLAVTLRNGEAAARRAATDAERARAEYGAASLLFHQRYVAFYNGALWGGQRVYAVGLFHPLNPAAPDQPLPAADTRKLEQYHWQHAALAQALARFQRVANRYPHTPEAPKALYSAALCYTLLQRLDQYWAGPVSDRFREKAIALYARIRRDYPHDPLAAAAARFGATPGTVP